MTTNECFLIAHGLPYVEFSHRPRTANLKGSFVAKNKVKDEAEPIVEDSNWQESYWKKEEIEGYKKLCSDYEAGTVPVKVLDKHPRDLSLREFMCNFTKKWKYCPAEVFPYFIPTFRYVVNKSKKYYEDYCRSLLLQDKPGCTFDNVGKNFKNCEEELRDFVENSSFCPNLVKEEFKESQLGGDNPNQNPDPFIGGDDLYMDEEEGPERAPKDDYMHVYALGDEEDPTNDEDIMRQIVDEFDDPDLAYCDETGGNKIVSDNIDKNEHRLKLGMSQDDILDSHQWIKQMKELHGETDNQDEEEIKCPDKDQLNFKQKIAYDLIEEFVNEKMTVEGKDVTLYLNISGKAGCGKSAVIKCISKYIRSKTKPSFMKIGAPTGTAAFLVKGSTLHTLFQLPINNLKGKMPEIKGDRLRDLQQRFEDVELLVIDEKSMIGQYMLYMIEERLRQAKPSKADLPFGGVSIILMGDFAQLAPVMDPPLFTEPDGKSKNSSNPQIVTGHQLFKTHFSENSLIFDEVYRQGPDQKEFKRILEGISNGQLSLEDWENLRTRELTDRNFTAEQIKAIKNKSIKVCAMKRDTKKHNQERTKALGKPIHGIKSLNTGKDAKNASENDAQGLRQDIIIAEGSRVLLCRNLWQSKGLCNGSIGEVKYIVYPEKSNHKKLQLPVVICHFPDYTGPSYLKDDARCVPIVVEDSHFIRNKEQCTRKMLPLKPGYAISIHSSQGAELDSVIVDVGPREFAAGLVYVALSRVRRMQNLFFDPFRKRPRFLSIGKTKVFAQRVKQDEREKISDARYALLAREKMEQKKQSPQLSTNQDK